MIQVSSALEPLPQGHGGGFLIVLPSLALLEQVYGMPLATRLAW